MWLKTWASSWSLCRKRSGKLFSKFIFLFPWNTKVATGHEWQEINSLEPAAADTRVLSGKIWGTCPRPRGHSNWLPESPCQVELSAPGMRSASLSYWRSRINPVPTSRVMPEWLFTRSPVCRHTWAYVHMCACTQTHTYTPFSYKC